MTTASNVLTSVTSAGIVTTATIYFRDSVESMIPWLICSIPLIVLDLRFGIPAAKYRGENVKFSKAFRGTFGKIVEYVAWVCFAASASKSFETRWVEWVVLGGVYLNEIISIIGNYLAPKGLKFSWRYFFNWVAKIFGQKAGLDTEGFDTGELIKPQDGKGAMRDKKTGRYIKRK